MLWMGASDRTRRIELHCALENRLHGYIVVNQQLSRLQVGYNRVTRLHCCPSTT